MRLPQIHDFFSGGVPWFGAVAEGWNASARVVIMPSFGSAAISGGGDGRPRQPFYDTHGSGYRGGAKALSGNNPVSHCGAKAASTYLGRGKRRGLEHLAV